MPYKSERQRRWAHATAGTRRGMSRRQVAEWDRASKGLQLPERAKRKKGGR